MPNYIVNRTKQYDAAGNLYYEVHQSPRSMCESPDYPNLENQVSLGYCSNCKSALLAAELEGYHIADGCAYCCPDCSTR